MISLAPEFTAWKNAQTRDVILLLLDIEINDSTTRRLVAGDPLGTGSLVFNGETYTAAAVEIDDYSQDIRGGFPSFKLAVSNIDGIAGGYIEANDLSGQRVTIRRVLLESLRKS